MQCLCETMTRLCQVHQGVSLVIQFPLLHLHTAQSDLGQGGDKEKQEEERGEQRAKTARERGR